MYERTKDAPWEGAKTTTNETVNRIVNEKVADADILKIQTAKTLEDAARKLRSLTCQRRVSMSSRSCRMSRTG